MCRSPVQPCGTQAAIHRKREVAPRSASHNQEKSMRAATRLTIGTGIGMALLGVACQHGHPKARHAEDADREQDERHGDRLGDGDRREPALGSGISSNSAVRSIANARCDREQRCGNIGADKDFASVDGCEEKIKADWNDELNKYECPNGIVQAELDECLNDIKQEDCGNPFDSLARVMSCNSSDICDG
jgi:hypothetical protein